jgi:hypothetical protein
LVRALVFLLLVTAAYVALRSKRDMDDVLVYRTAGLRAMDAAPLYRPDDGHYQFKYLPAFALAMAPVALVPEEVMKPIWFAASAWLVLIFVTRAAGGVPAPLRPFQTVFWLTALVTAKFWVLELIHGQTNVLLGVVLLAALRAARNGRPLAAGALAGAAVFVKPYALITIPWLVVAAGPSSVVSAGAVIAAGLLLPAATYGWHGNLAELHGWLSTVTETTAPNLLVAENISFATMWAKWLGPGDTATHLALATSVVAAIAAATVIAVRRRVPSDPAYLEFALLMVLVPLVSPQGWDYVLLVAAPAYACALDRWPAQPALWRAATLAAIALTSFAIFDLWGRTLYMLIVHSAAVSLGAMLLATILIGLRARRLA